MPLRKSKVIRAIRGSKSARRPSSQVSGGGGEITHEGIGITVAIIGAIAMVIGLKNYDARGVILGTSSADAWLVAAIGFVALFGGSLWCAAARFIKR
jgi:hypothetical protein